MASMAMASLPFLMKLLSCFAMNDDSVSQRRSSSRTHSLTREIYTDAFSSHADCESVALASTNNSTSTVYCSAREWDWDTVANPSTVCANRRHLHEMDVRPNESKRLRGHLCNTSTVPGHNTSTVPGKIVRPNHRKRLREHLYSPSTITTDQEASFFAKLTAKDGEEPRRKRQHVRRSPSDELSDQRSDMQISGHVVNHTGLKKSQAHATAKIKTAWALIRTELNYAKSQLNITQARCEQLQEENRWLRNNVPDEEDSLLRREVEMLLAKKSQLNLDKANLMREKERLLQLVEYLQKGSPSVEYE